MKSNNSEYQYTIFNVVGNSMDNGKRKSFENGDTVYTKQVETSEFAKAIQGDLDSYWVICTDNGALLRKVVSFNGESGIHCKALNPEYEDCFIGLQEVKAMYRVMTLQPQTIYYN